MGFFDSVSGFFSGASNLLGQVNEGLGQFQQLQSTIGGGQLPQFQLPSFDLSQLITFADPGAGIGQSGGGGIVGPPAPGPVDPIFLPGTLPGLGGGPPEPVAVAPPAGANPLLIVAVVGLAVLALSKK